MPSIICCSPERYKLILKRIFLPVRLTVPPASVVFCINNLQAACTESNVMLFIIYDDNNHCATAAYEHFSNKLIFCLPV